MKSEPIDMAAVARVAKRVNLDDIILTGVRAVRTPPEKEGGLLLPIVKHAHEVAASSEQSLRVRSQYDVRVELEGKEVILCEVIYELAYTLDDGELIPSADLEHFATANGSYHSWPFAREILYSLTGRMGLPPFVLPVLSFRRERPSKET